MAGTFFFKTFKVVSLKLLSQGTRLLRILKHALQTPSLEEALQRILTILSYHTFQVSLKCSDFFFLRTLCVHFYLINPNPTTFIEINGTFKSNTEHGAPPAWSAKHEHSNFNLWKPSFYLTELNVKVMQQQTKNLCGEREGQREGFPCIHSLYYRFTFTKKESDLSNPLSTGTAGQLTSDDC